MEGELFEPAEHENAAVPLVAQCKHFIYMMLIKMTDSSSEE
jgi:hypothetical protein